MLFIKYTQPYLSDVDPYNYSNENEARKIYNESIERQKKHNITSDLVYFDFKRNKKYFFEFNIAKYACDLGYKKLYYSLENSYDYMEDEYPSYKWKNYVIWDSIAKAVNN